MGTQKHTPSDGPMLSLGPLFQIEWEEVDVEYVEVVAAKLPLKANMLKFSCCCNDDLVRAAMVDMILSSCPS